MLYVVWCFSYSWGGTGVLTQDTLRSIDKTIFANSLLQFKADGNVYNFAYKTNFNCWNELKTKAWNNKIPTWPTSL